MSIRVSCLIGDFYVFGIPVIKCINITSSVPSIHYWRYSITYCLVLQEDVNTLMNKLGLVRFTMSKA